MVQLTKDKSIAPHMQNAPTPKTGDVENPEVGLDSAVISDIKTTAEQISAEQLAEKVRYMLKIFEQIFRSFHDSEII